ncbi:hypothetical protein DCAR_0313690 [Daucus carota subsp. sativus]|uniref:Leucine-rich repeat-containing N-terminal plant-type domain-containing protein n=2 Tax=Daucus carota subsp. sativus TaxID=79200 RepID=A0AAF1AW39_DAUCS|nr:hypothetical protein DCAR_0313690 [Daucus carota subsp. sativus]
MFKGFFTSMIVLLFLQQAVSSPSATTTHLCSDVQKLALFQFKLSLSIEACASTHCDISHPKTMSWTMSSDCCSWDGVTCNQLTGDVIGLDLSCSCLGGSILPNSTLFQLSYLQFLNFRANNISGVLPQGIFHLHNLKQLRVDYNSNLTISLPEVKWESSSSLQILSLSETTFSGGIPDSIGYLNSLSSLSLRKCKFSGLIPRFIGNLTRLTTLDLSSNNFSGPIPDSFANLQNLTYLFLDINNLVGQFPSWVANLRQLVGLDLSDNGLDLSDNSLRGPLPSNLTALQLPQLTALYLSNNSLNGTIPSWLFDLPSLAELSLDHNDFTGQIKEFNSSRSPLRSFSCANNLLNGNIPLSLSTLVNLIDLELSSNNFPGFLDVDMFSHLYTLDLSHNGLSLRITNMTKFNPNLESLGLASCNIKKFPHFIKSLEHLQDLDLSNNLIDGEIPQWIWKDSLNDLDLSHNFLTGGLHHLLQNRLFFLKLQYNTLSGSLPDSICNSSSLEILNLSHNNFTGALPTCSRSLESSLSVLGVLINRISGSLPSTLSNFRMLRSLNLYGNKLEGTVPPSFAKFDHLEVLDLGSNQLNGAFPQWLEYLKNLQVLILKSNKFHGMINNSSKIEHPFPSLRIIDLSDNMFSGPLPAKYIKNFKAMMDGEVNRKERSYMGNSYYSDTIITVIKGVETEYVKILTVFTTIDLSRNKFEGQIPEYIGNLKSLINLNLSQNHLTGHIPSLIGNLLLLESLDFSFNRLTGVIPQQLTSIYTLSRLNLSHNDLSGRIPEGAQFYTFQNDSYAGNLALCGQPLSIKCERETNEMQEEEDEGDDYFFNGFTWEAVVIGYGSGVVLGFVVGYIMFMVGKPKWFMGIIARELGLKVRRLEIKRFA